MTLATALFLTAALSGLGPAPEARGGSQGRAQDALLDLPYLTQTQQLCGGAALAMVLRYWGTRDVFAEDFAALVDDQERGIRTSVLAEAARRRGLEIVVGAPDGSAGTDWLRRQIQLGRPVIALIEERPRLYHYVVIAGVTDTAVVYHDPARAPYRVVPRADFEARWSAAGRWMLLAVPSNGAGDTSTRTPPPPPGARDTSPCQALVAASVAHAADGNTAAAERGLEAATALCPLAPDGWVELAGLRFLERRYPEAGALAARAVERDPTAAHAWRILGTTKFLSGNTAEALEAWNRLGEPTTDVVSVEGASRTPHPVIVRATGLTPRSLLTAEAIRRAARRLSELPASSQARMRYEPQPGGTAAVTALITERPPYPSGAAAWVAVGINTAFLREIKLGLFGLARQGDAIDVSYRFRHNRPRVRGELALPAPGGLPGVLAVESMWERQAYSAVSAGRDDVLREERRRTGLRWADWATSTLRWQVGAALDRFDSRSYAALDAQIGVRLLDDHVSVRGSWATWMAGGAPAFSVRDVSGAWRSNNNDEGWGLQARTGLTTATSGAPLALWPLASSSSSRGVLLRGRGLYDEGIVTTNILGRRLAFSTIEYAHPVRRDALGSIGIAGFVDVGRAWRRRQAVDASDWQFDVGAGLRLKVPAIPGQIRLDAGYATRIGRMSLSAGYVVPWGL